MACLSGRIHYWTCTQTYTCTRVTTMTTAPGAFQTSNCNTLVLFDIDGTLLVSKPGLTPHKEAFSYAIEKVHGIKCKMSEIQYHGMTDQMITHDLLALHGVSEEKIWSGMPAVIEEMCEYALPKLTPDIYQVLPGVKALLATLRHQGCVIGLVTGNLEPIGWKKMESAGLKEFFDTGAFGSDHTDRGTLIQIAIDKAMSFPNARFHGERRPHDDHYLNVYHIGDAPSDVKAAREANVNGIGVTTGVYSAQQLAEYEPYAVVAGLSELSNILQLLSLGDPVPQ
eukprot:GFYU01002471.1.p1 GENE.GFYU01002471.1~~GFYU01002471.1.p1  ORF type:complete len:282 (-),score=65.13 GFYU01002471.1:504-1349(-)